MENDMVNVENWEGKTMQIYGWEVPEQILNKLKSKLFVEMAAKNLRYDRLRCSTKWISLFYQNKFFICYPSLSCKISSDFIQLDRGPPGLSTKQSLATTVKENC